MHDTGLLNYQEAADLLGVSAKTVRRLVDSGQIASIRLTPYTIRFERADVEAFIERRKTEVGL